MQIKLIKRQSEFKLYKAITYQRVGYTQDLLTTTKPRHSVDRINFHIFRYGENILAYT